MTVQTEEFVYPAWSLGDRIRKARDVSGLNQHDFALAIAVADGSLANWETDRAKPRDIVAVAKRIELLTRIPAGWLLGIDNGPGGDGGPNGSASAPTAGKSSCFNSAGLSVVRMLPAMAGFAAQDDLLAAC